MENLRNIESAKSVEVVSSGKVRRLVMAISLAIMAAVGGGCGKNLDSMDQCLGENQASEHKSRLASKKKVCKERVDDYIKSKDGDSRPILRNDAQLACSSYSRELYVTGQLVEAKQDSARMQRDWSKRDSCAKAVEVTKNRADELMGGDMAKLIRE